MRASRLLLLCAARCTSASLRAPLASVTWCNVDGRASDAACGPAVKDRSSWNNNLCTIRTAKKDTPLIKSLKGATLDIVLIPDEDETLWIEDSVDGNYFGGIVGDAVNEMATLGEFTWNAIVVNPPKAGDTYDGDWDKWAADWTNRADIVAAWFFETSARRDQGLFFPSSYYDLSPALLVQEKGKVVAEDNLSQMIVAWAQPYSWDLWVVVLATCWVVGFCHRFVEGKATPLLNIFRKGHSCVAGIDELFTCFYYGFFSFIDNGKLCVVAGSTTWSGRLVILTWMLSVWVLKSAFTATLATRQTVALGETGAPLFSAEDWSTLKAMRQTA